MSKSALITLVFVFAIYAALQTFVAARYEYYNDRLTFALGQCIGVNKMRRP